MDLRVFRLEGLSADKVAKKRVMYTIQPCIGIVEGIFLFHFCPQTN